MAYKLPKFLGRSEAILTYAGPTKGKRITRPILTTKTSRKKVDPDDEARRGVTSQRAPELFADDRSRKSRTPAIAGGFQGGRYTGYSGRSLVAAEGLADPHRPTDERRRHPNRDR